MASSELQCVTWNVNGLSLRITDIHSYVTSNDVDILALQEVGPGGSIFDLPGYQKFVLESNFNNNTRGLITFVKNSMPVNLIEASKANGTEILVVNLHLSDIILSILNIYVHADKLDLEDLPSCILDNKCLVMGDLNARHRELGTTGSQNKNGHVLKSIVDSLESVKILGNPEPTHVRGGRIDYAMLFNMEEFNGSARVLSILVSDHFALSITINVEKQILFTKRKRLSLKEEDKPSFINGIIEWYDSYKRNDGHNNDENKFYDDLLGIVNKLLDKPRKNNKKNSKKGVRYSDDKVIKGWNKLLKKAHSNWSKNQNEQNKELMLQIADCTSEARCKTRGKYWDEFLNNISFIKTLSGVWNEVNKVRGVRKKIAAHPDPVGKATELMQKWAEAASFKSLPSNVQANLIKNHPRRHSLIQMQKSLWGETCSPFTKQELLMAIKKGKSTSPGEDGVTYEIINILISLENSPLHDLFDLSYKNGRLPLKWKIALIIAILKANGDPRPISLTTCIAKCMERIVLGRLIYKVGDQLSNNLFGFLKGKSTNDCVVKVLSNANATCRVFIDLKGAFDKANRDVILEELINKGVTGKLLGWVESYLSGRKGKVLYQGCESNEMDLELGTPQGGVLSPFLFNILMDKIARHEFPTGVQIVIYADDIVIQSSNIEGMKIALDKFSSLCLQMGLVINENKCKYQIKSNVDQHLMINGQKLEKVNSYKYLGMYISFSKNSDEINYLRNVCLARLKPLQVLANKGNGAGIPVLRTVYISTVRSIIDYAAPLLINYSENELKPLEIIQNKAMRLILGCPRTARIEIMRAELNFCSITHRIQELAIVTVIRMIRRGETSLKMMIDKVAGIRNRSIKINCYVKKLFALISKYGTYKYCTKMKEVEKIKPWVNPRLSVDITKLDDKKGNMNIYELKYLFMSKINEITRINSVHIYCDGSVNENKVGCGAIIREYNENSIYSDHMISKRIEDHASIMTAELIAIQEGLNYATVKKKPIFVFSDSQSALLSLKSQYCQNNIVINCKKLVMELSDFDIEVKFIWIPSHIGIHLNDIADYLAKEATHKENIDIESAMTIQAIKSQIRNIRNAWEIENLQNILDGGSASLSHYLYINEKTRVTYGKGLTKIDTLTMRLRLGYSYTWEYVGKDGFSCKLCKDPGSHKLFHYIMNCPSLNEFRSDTIDNMLDMIVYFINNDVISQIVKKFNKLAIQW